MKRSNTILFTFLFLLTSLLISTTSTFAQLVGGNTYPINGVENPPTTFNNLTSAVAYLTTNGVTGSGEVIMELSGGYPGELAPVTIPVITGTSSTLGITFRPATGTLINTTIAGTASPNQFALKVTGNYITLDGRAGGIGAGKDWTITCTGGTTTGLGQMAIKVDNTTNNMTGLNFRYLKLVGEAASTTGAVFQITGVTANTISNVTIEENYITSTADTSIRTRGYGVTLAVASNIGNTGIVVRNNEITDFYARGINHTGGFPGIQIYGNQIYHTKAITQPSTTEFSAIYNSTTASAGAKFFNNYIHDIKLTNGTTGAYGIYLFNGNTSGAPIEIYNNRIQIGNGITATTFPVYGIRDNAVSGSLFNIYYNSVLVDGIVAAGTSNSAAFRKEVSNFINLKNNIFYNTRTNSGGTGTHWGISINNTTFASINNNDYFADGTGGVLGTTTGLVAGNQTTLSGWKSVVLADVNSVSQNPNYVAGLKIDTVIPSQLEAGGTPVVSVTLDFEGDTRNATTPDIGADEFAGTPLDLVAPTISYTAIINTSNTTSVSLTANITDVSGIDTAANAPRLYMKKGVLGTYGFDNAPVIVGSDYTFTLNYSSLGGVLPGDTLFYYVAAQDLNANAGTNPSGGSGSTPPGTIPPANPNFYQIVNLPLNGSYTVGLNLFNRLLGKNITFEKSIEKVFVEVPVEETANDKYNSVESTSASLNIGTKTELVEVEKVNWIPMENGNPYNGALYLKKAENPQFDFPDGVQGVYANITAAANDLNLRGLDGATTFLLVDTLYSSETLPISINIVNSNLPTSTNTITIKPGIGVLASITGASASSQVFKILNNYVTLDGSNNGGVTRDLTIANTSTTSPQVILVGSFGTSTRMGVAIKNTNIINGVNTSTALIISDGTTAGNPGYFKDVVVQNNTIQKAYMGAYCNAVVASGNGRGLFISQNQLTSAGTNALRYVGFYIQGVDSALVSQNTIANFDGVSGEDDRGIWLATGTRNTVVERNNINSLKYTGTGGYGTYGVAVSSGTTNANIVLLNNLISNLSGDGWNYTSVLGDNTHGLYLFSAQTGIYAYYNSINLEGNTLNQTSALSTGICIGTGTTADLKNNIINNNLGLSAATGFGSAGIFLQTATTQLNYSNYNDIYVNPTGSGAKNIGQVVAEGYTDLASWQTASGKDSNSVSVIPQFNTLTDLQPLWTSPVLAAGNPVVGVTTDYLGITRSLTTPSIGAYENGIILPMSGTYTVGLAAFNSAYGKNVYFEKIYQTVNIDLDAVDSYLDRNAFDYTEKYEGERLTKPERFKEVVEEKVVLMENGKIFDQNFFRAEQTLGIYPTITSAVADLTLRGVDGPVTLSLVDALYSNETYPILIPTIVGADSVNTITIKPASGVQAEIPGSVTQASSTLQLGGGSNVIIDGSNTVGGTTKDLTISAQTTTAPAIHFYSGGNNNKVLNTIVQSKNTSTGSGSLIFGSGTGSMNNLIENCTFKRVDTSSVRFGIGTYFFSSTLSSNNTIYNSGYIDFANRGITIQGAAGITGNKAIGNEIYQVNPSAGTTLYGIYLARGPQTVFEANYIHDLKSSGATPTIAGIYYIGASLEVMTASIINNVVSLAADYSQPAGVLRGLDYFGYAANSVEFFNNTVFINGSDVTGTSVTAGITKRDAVTSYVAKNNTVFNNRSNGTGTGKHYSVYVSNTVATSVAVDYNNYFVEGIGGVLGLWNTTDQLTLSQWITTTGVDSNSISANPQHVSTTDLKPQLTSPLLAAGVSLPQVTTDFLGVIRGNPPTIGAFEQGVLTPLSGPTNLVAIGDTNAVLLNWTDNSIAEFGFYIERKNGDTLSVDPYVLIDSVNTNEVNYIDTGRAPNSTYTYRVRAFNNFGVSPYSNEVTATTIIPVELTSFAASVGNDNLISIVWSTATELNNSGFNLERKLDGEWQKVAFVEGKGTTTEKTDYSFVDKFKYESFQGTIQYRLKQIDFDGTFSYSKVASVEVDFTPKEYTLFQNYPNPFNPSTTIKFALPFDSNVRISVYNLIGEQVEVIFDQVKEVGYHNISWNASDLASGVYIYTIDAKSLDGLQKFNSVKKMMLVK